jgi:hypothetical protein
VCSPKPAKKTGDDNDIYFQENDSQLRLRRCINDQRPEFLAQPGRSGRGRKLQASHEVHWQNAIVPAGEYRFTLQSVGPSMMLRLTKLTGAPASYMLMVNDCEEDATGSKQSVLLINSKPGMSYVSSMALPEFEVKLNFAPPATTGKEMALLHTASLASPSR